VTAHGGWSRTNSC